MPDEYRVFFDGEKKLTRTVFALNKKDDLKDYIETFEDEKNAELERKLENRGWVAQDGGRKEPGRCMTPIGSYIERNRPRWQGDTGVSQIRCVEAKRSCRQIHSRGFEAVDRPQVEPDGEARIQAFYEHAGVRARDGENIKTVSVLMGHASSAYTLDLYAGYVPNTGIGIGVRYMNFLRAAA